jgi:CHRD domain
MTSGLMKTLGATALLVGLTAMPAAAQTFTLKATLSGAGEATSIANGVNTGAFGDCTVVVDMGAQSVNYSVNVFNLPSGVTASHIHVGAEKTSGPVVVNFVVPQTASNDFGFSGTTLFSAFVLRPDQGIRSSDDMVQAILGGNSYCNVHSAVNPAGEIRGQLVLQK